MSSDMFYVTYVTHVTYVTFMSLYYDRCLGLSETETPDFEV